MSRKDERQEQKLIRANKLTTVWSGDDGVAVGRFYKTHEKIQEIRSDNPVVVKAGFKMPETTEENPVSPQQKLESFKSFLGMNAGVFGIHYDPVDRRSDEYKFPSSYDVESFKEYSLKQANSVLSACITKTQVGVIDKMISAGHIPTDTKIDFGIDEDAKIDITDHYKNGNIKYATAKYDVVLQIEDSESGARQVEDVIVVELVSGQLRKPRSMENISLTQTAVKNAFVESGFLPKIERKSKKDKESAEDVEQVQEDDYETVEE